MLFVNGKMRIPHREFFIRYSRSSGPGGQNVNKVNSKAHIVWNPMRSPSIPSGVKRRFKQRFAGKLNALGEIRISSDRYRDQKRNLQDCYDKLKTMLLQVANPPKKRVPTRPTRASQKKRQDQKKVHSNKKRLRKKVSWD